MGIDLPLQLKILAMTEHKMILLLRWLSMRQIHLALNEWAIHSAYAIASTYSPEELKNYQQNLVRSL